MFKWKSSSGRTRSRSCMLLVSVRKSPLLSNSYFQRLQKSKVFRLNVCSLRGEHTPSSSILQLKATFLCSVPKLSQECVRFQTAWFPPAVQAESRSNAQIKSSANWFPIKCFPRKNQVALLFQRPASTNKVYTQLQIRKFNKVSLSLQIILLVIAGTEIELYIFLNI